MGRAEFRRAAFRQGRQQPSVDMTFTEAAVEVLRRSGKPLHFKEIAARAVEDGLLSHVGQLPEVTMGARLLAMARREQDRRVSSLGDGVFALSEWGLPEKEEPGEGVELEPGHQEGPAYRSRERHPPLQEEVLVGGRREERRRRAEDDGERRRKRYPPPAEVAHKWLRAHGEVATLAELAAGLRADDSIAEALERDLKSLEKALKEENRRCADSGRTPLFVIENGSVRALPPGQARPARATREAARVEKREAPRTVPAAEEQRRSVMRTLRRRLGGLDVAAFERVCVAILEAEGYRDLNMARRSQKDGPLYLARRRWGANELRYTIRILPPGRDIGRAEVQELRRDLAHYSAQIGVLFGTAECTRESKSEGNVPGAPPVMLYGSEAVAEALIDTRLGVTTRTIEWLEFDDAFFTSVGAPEAEAERETEPSASREERQERPERQGQKESKDQKPPKDQRESARTEEPRTGEPGDEQREKRKEERKERSRRQKDRRRERRGAEAAAAPADVTAPTDAATQPADGAPAKAPAALPSETTEAIAVAGTADSDESRIPESKASSEAPEPAPVTVAEVTATESPAAETLPSGVTEASASFETVPTTSADAGTAAVSEAASSRESVESRESSERAVAGAVEGKTPSASVSATAIAEEPSRAPFSDGAEGDGRSESPSGTDEPAEPVSERSTSEASASESASPESGVDRTAEGSER